MSSIIIFVPGEPRSQGSKRWLPNGGLKEAGAENLRPWRASVTSHTVAEMRRENFPTLEGPVYVTIDFLYLRPKSHYGTGKNSGTLKPSAPMFKATMPDIDKLCRAILDSLTDASLFRDDGQVASLTATKTFGEQQGARIEIGEIR